MNERKEQKEADVKSDTYIVKILSILLITIVGIVITVYFCTKKESVDLTYYDTYELSIGKEIVTDKGSVSEIIWDESTLNACNSKLYNYFLRELDFNQKVYVISHGKPIKGLYTTSFKNVKIYSERGRVLYIQYKDGDFPLKDYIYIVDNSNGPYCTEHEQKYLPQ